MRPQGLKPEVGVPCSRAMESPVLGIDFGTTNTSAAFFDAQGKLKLVPIREKLFVMPSVVWYRAADKAVVGHAARSQIIDDPRHTIFEAKRFLGRRYQSEYVARHREKFAYELVEGEDGYFAFHVYGQVKPLTDVARQVIEHVSNLAAQAAGQPFTECVVGVPAHSPDIFPALISSPAAASRRRSSVDFQIPASAAFIRMFQRIASSLLRAGCAQTSQRALVRRGPRGLDVGGVDVDVLGRRGQPTVSHELLDGLERQPLLVEVGRAVVAQHVGRQSSRPAGQPPPDRLVHAGAQRTVARAGAVPTDPVAAFARQQRGTRVVDVVTELVTHIGQPPLQQCVDLVDGRQGLGPCG